MKKLLTLFSFLAMAGGAQASHFLGADIRYAAEGGKYRVYLTVYSDCGGVAPSPAASVAVTGCGTSVVRTLPRIKTDTLTDGFCPAASVGCGSNYLFSYTLATTYSDTMTLASCANWKIGYADGARAGNITNLANPSMANMYVEAMLNNSTAANTNAKLSNPAPVFAAVGTANYFPLHATDPDGDSTAYELIVPRASSTTNAPYASSSYSASQPLGGTGSGINAATKLLRLQGASQGRYTVVLRTSDYRNGVLVGYTERDWAIMNIPATNPKIPVPAPSNNFVYNACPGQPGSLALSFVDSNATDSVFMTVEPSIPLAVSLAGGSGLGSATGTLSWTTPASLNPATTPYFYLHVKVRDNSCPIRAIATYDVLVHVKSCNTDSVWAGDADANYVVNLYDPLAIAVAFGKTGTARPGASTAWTAQYCPNWATAFSNGVNHKHADCDGNGTVGLSDLGAVLANYSLTHTRTTDDGPAAKVAGLPDLHVASAGVALKPGATVSVPVKLGDAASVMYNLYGVAARVRILNITPDVAPTVDFGTSWLGTAGNTVRFQKSTSTASIDWACGRTDGVNINGQGTLGALQFTVPANVAVGSKVIFRIEAARLIDKNGTVLSGFNTVDDTATIVAAGSSNTGITAPAGMTDAAIVPNPSSGAAAVQAFLAQPGAVTLNLVNALGQSVWTATETGTAGFNAWTLPAANLPAGWYFLTLRAGAGAQPVQLRWLVQE